MSGKLDGRIEWSDLSACIHSERVRETGEPGELVEQAGQNRAVEVCMSASAIGENLTVCPCVNL